MSGRTANSSDPASREPDYVEGWLRMIMTGFRRFTARPEERVAASRVIFLNAAYLFLRYAPVSEVRRILEHAIEWGSN